MVNGYISFLKLVISCSQNRVVNIVAPVKLLYEIILLSRVDIITFISKPNINTYL
jgi:hypothetical protein